MHLWAHIVPVMNGSGFFSSISSSASGYICFSTSSIYSLTSWCIGQPPMQGAVKQSAMGRGRPFFLSGRGFTGFL